MANEYWLALRADGFKGTGKAYDPYDASSPSLFNTLMLQFATDNPQGQVCIHLGPGIFQVPARRALEGLWWPRSGWRIVGAGKYATILKVVGATTNFVEVQVAIGNDGWYQYAEGFTIEDLTIDCNMRGHKDIACSTGGVGLAGSRTKVRRVRVIDFGTETDKECFPVFTAGGHLSLPEPRNCEITDCIAEKPSPNNVRETTILSFGAGEVDDNGNVPAGQPSFRGIMSYHRSCAIRKNMVDCDYSVDQRQIKEIRFTGTSATTRTFQPHNRRTGDWIIISGALVIDLPFTQGSVINPFNGSFQVTSVPSAYEFSYTMPDVPSAEPTGTIWLGRFPCQAIGIHGLSQQGTASPWIITVTTAKPHFRVPGQNVLIQGVTKRSVPGQPSPLNGPQRIIDVPSPTTFRFAFATDPASDWIIGGQIGVSLQALGGDSGIAALVERNRIFGAVIGGPYHDTWQTKDLVVRKNYYYANHLALYQNMGGFSAAAPSPPPPAPPIPPRHAETLTRGGADNKTATLTTPFLHGLAAGHVVQVRLAHVGGILSTTFNGVFSVETVLSPKSFTYRMNGDPGGNADTDPEDKRPILDVIWQVGRIIYTRNIVEPITNPLGTGAPPTAFNIGSRIPFSPFYVFREVIVAKNRIRNMDGGSDPLSIGIYVYSTEAAIIQKNTIGGVNEMAIRHFDIGKIRRFHNVTFGGDLSQGAFFSSSTPDGVYLNQLETELDLALTAKPAATQPNI